MILWILFTTFFKIGLFTFGGGYAMIPMIQQEILGYGWISPEQLVDFIAISESTPGPFAVNIATFVGLQAGGIWGAFFATLGVVLPSFVIILIIAKFFKSFGQNTLVKAGLGTLQPAVLGLIAAAVWSIAIQNYWIQNAAASIAPQIDWRAILITAGVLFISRLRKSTHPIMLMVISAASGILLYTFIGSISKS